MNDAKPSWLPDAHPSFPDEDEFGVDELIDQLVMELEHAEPPFAVSLSGSWGVGKSAIAREAVTRLRDRGIRCVFIDAWTLDVDHLRRHLVIEVGAALRTGSSGDLPDKDDRKAVADKIDSAASQTTIQDAARVELRGLGDIARQIRDTPMTLVAILAVVAALLAIAYRTHGLDPFLLTIAGVLALALMTTYVVRLSTPSRSRAPAASEVLLADEFREIVSAAPRRKFIIGRAEPRQVVIVVDNLDRLTGRDALAALSQIRGLLEIDGSRCLFLIPIDRHRLEEHLRGELKRDTAAADYLEKFFGLDLALTQPQPVDLRRWATKRAHRIAPAEADDIELARMADVVTAATDRSPRMIVRVLNGAMSRHRVVSRMGRSLTLPQAALIEGVLLLANGRLAHLEKDPRSLIDLRQALVERWPDADKALANFFGVSVGGGSSMPAQAIRLAQFLRSTAHVPLAWEDVRIALALRKNRLWATVPDWETFAGPLEEGEVDAFAEALRDRSDRDSVVASSVEALIDLGRSFRTLVGLPVVAPHIATDTPRAATLRALAIEFLAEDEWGFSRLTEDASHFLFEDAGETAPNLASKLVAATTAASTPHSRGVVRALLLLRSKLSEADLDKVRKQLATWSHDELQPLFEEPTGTTFIEGPVAESMIATLESWDPSLTGSMSEQTMAARRLRAARDHGWSGAGLERVATRAANYTTQIAANEEAWPTAEAIIELLRGLDPTPEVDALGQALGQPFAGDRQFFAWALQLNLSHTASVNVINRFDAWAKAAPLDRVAEVLDEHRAVIDAGGSSYRQLLMDRWKQKGHTLAATLAIEGDANGPDALIAASASAQADDLLPRARHAMAILHEQGHAGKAHELAHGLAGVVASAPFSLPGLQELVEWMKAKKISRQDLVDGVVSKMQAVVAPNDMPALLNSVRPVLSMLGVNQQRGIADAAGAKLLQLGQFDPTTTADIVARMSGSDLREDILVKMIESGHSLDATLEALDNCRSALGKSDRIHDALTARASREQQESNAARDLKEAKRWRRTSKRSEAAEADLEAVYARFPTLRPEAAAE